MHLKNLQRFFLWAFQSNSKLYLILAWIFLNIIVAGVLINLRKCFYFFEFKIFKKKHFLFLFVFRIISGLPSVSQFTGSINQRLNQSLKFIWPDPFRHGRNFRVGALERRQASICKSTCKETNLWSSGFLRITLDGLFFVVEGIELDDIWKSKKKKKLDKLKIGVQIICDKYENFIEIHYSCIWHVLEITMYFNKLENLSHKVQPRILLKTMLFYKIRLRHLGRGSVARRVKIKNDLVSIT